MADKTDDIQSSVTIAWIVSCLTLGVVIALGFGIKEVQNAVNDIQSGKTPVVCKAP